MKIVYQTDAAGVYIGEVIADESPLEPGVFLIPGGCVDIRPPECAQGIAARFDGQAWSKVPDWRGISLYRKENGAPTSIDVVDMVPSDINATPTPRPTIDDVWNDVKNDWETDPEKRAARLTEKVRSKRDTLLSTASLRIAPLQDALDMNDASAAEKAALVKWKQHRIDVNRIDQQASFPEIVVWPDTPND